MKFPKLINLTFCLVALGMLFFLNSCGDTTGPSGDSDTKIVSFHFADLTPVVIGTINHTNKTISLKVPPMTNKQYLVPTIVIPTGATIDPASGVLQNFNIPVQYTVTAKDGTKAIYTVTVTEDNTSVNPIELSGTYNENKTLPNIREGVDYYINERIYISGNSLLTVQPGVTIEFTSVDGAITIEENAGIQMIGTPANPIIFKGPANNPNKASWAGLELHSNRADNIWKYVQIYNGGRPNEDYAALYLGTNASLSMENCIISGAGYFGIYLEDNTKFIKFDNNEIKDCDNAPIYLSNFGQAAPISNNSILAVNANKYVKIAYYTSIVKDLTINALDVPYLCKSIYVTGSKVVINPGVELQFQIDGIFSCDNDSQLESIGTASKPIIFTAEKKFAGQWKGVELFSNQNNSIAYANIEYGGQNESQNLYFWDCKVNLSNVNIKHSSNYGINYNAASIITHSGVTYSDCANGNVYYYDDGTVHENLP